MSSETMGIDELELCLFTIAVAPHHCRRLVSMTRESEITAHGSFGEEQPDLPVLTAS